MKANVHQESNLRMHGIWPEHLYLDAVPLHVAEAPRGKESYIEAAIPIGRPGNLARMQ